MTGGQAHPLPLLGECFSCGASNGVAYHHADGSAEHYCPRCAQRYAMATAAQQQLESGVREVVRAWLTIWGSTPEVIDLYQQLLQIGSQIEQDYKAGALDPEGVRALLRVV